ncbi:MAG: lysophospholipid acyltransferase family protein [Gemmataceae bacterium]
MSRWGSELWYQFNFCLTYLVYTFGWSFKSSGQHHVPPSGPVLILANHESFLDPVAIGLAVRRRINYLARKTLFTHPLFGEYLRSVGSVPVDQAGVAKEGLRASIDLLQAGKALLIFPEGERAWDGVMQAFKPGIALVLRKAPVTILPVGVAGAYQAYPRAAKLPRFAPLFWPPSGAGIACSIGAPIPPERYANLEREELLDFLFQAVKGEVEKAEKLRLK